jgi:DNA-binding NtrC family response regulator
MKTVANITKNMSTILSVTPVWQDHDSLRTIFHGPLRNKDRWTLVTASSVEWATKMLRRDRVPIVICERDLKPGTWSDLLEQMATMPHSPLMIVTSRLADERLWSEVLNESGYDVLANPFDRTEVIRVVEGAFQHWQNQHETCSVRRALRIAS